MIDKNLNRNRIIELKKKNPLWGYGRIATELGIHRNTARNHLQEIYKQGLFGFERGRYRTDKSKRWTKQSAITYLGGKCLKCGYDKCLAAFDFHHRDPKQKLFEIAESLGHQSEMKYSHEAIKLELDKCDLLCCRCHRELHDEIKKTRKASPASQIS